MNRSLLKACATIQPSLLLLGHGQLINLDTLKEIKASFPNIKIAQWFVDALEKPAKTAFIRERLPILDAVFCSTAGPALAVFQKHGCRSAYLPNPVDRNIENLRAFDHDEHRFDLVFIGSDRKAPERTRFLERLAGEIGDLRFGIFGSCGIPGVYGQEKDDILHHTRAALNLTQYDPRPFYSSDRIAQIMGNGILTCVNEGFLLQDLYGEDSLLTFRNPEDLALQLRKVLQNNRWREIARRGWEVSHEQFSSEKIAAAMIDFIFENDSSAYPWPASNAIP